MTIPVILRPDAETDIQETYNTLEEARTGLGKRFLVRLRDTLERIEELPQIYGVIWQDVRAVRFRDFRHVVYYLTCTDLTEVLAVLHGSRDERIWQSRV